MSTLLVDLSFPTHSMRYGPHLNLADSFESLGMGQVIRIPVSKTEATRSINSSSNSLAGNTPSPSLTSPFQQLAYALPPGSPPDFALSAPSDNTNSHFVVILEKKKVVSPHNPTIAPLYRLLYLCLAGGGHPYPFVEYEPLSTNPSAQSDATRRQLWYRLGSRYTPESDKFPHPDGFYYLRDKSAGTLGLQPKETFLVGPFETYNLGSTSVGLQSVS